MESAAQRGVTTKIGDEAMISKFAFALSFLVAGLVFGQSPAAAPTQELPKDPRAILAAAEPYYDFSDPALKPFHLKATYQLYDPQGNPAERGTWEYWRISEKVSHSSWKRADAALSEWHTADGAVYRKQSGAKFRYFERNIAKNFMIQLPKLTEVDSGKFRLDPDEVKIGSHKLPCVIAIRPLAKDERRKGMPPAFTSYCFDPSASAMLFSASSSIATNYRDIALVENHYLAREVEIFGSGVKSFAAKVDTIGGIAASDTALTPDADAVQVTPPASNSEGSSVARDAPNPKPVNTTDPAYPPEARAERVQGEVVLGLIIDKKGHVQDPEVLAAPSPLLAKSALDAVKQWQFKPQILNGAPVDTDTMIQMDFHLF